MMSRFLLPHVVLNGEERAGALIASTSGEDR